MKYLIYCRKSTDTEDKQVLSLDSQEAELRSIADKLQLKVVEVVKESMSAKSDGRPLFNQALELVAKGRADAILCWKLDRLARNFIDGGKVIDMLQRGVIKEVRTYEGVHYPHDNVLMMAMQFGMANQYVRDLSENVKRGNRAKLQRGEWPNHAPFGYLNDRITKTIVVDPVRSEYIPKIFKLYISGSYGCNNISDLLYKEGLRTPSGKKVFKSQIHRILSSIFYTGLMEREGKYYQGKHQPLISKEIFDKAQDMLNNRTRPRPQRLFFPLRGFLSCENCGCAFTSSLKKGHHYYYCTNGKQKCNEHKTYMRETYLYDIISDLLGNIGFSERKIELMYQAAKERSEAENSYSIKALQDKRAHLESLKTKESRLLDAFLAEQVTKELYDQKILELQNERVSTLQRIKDLETEQSGFTLEPIKNLFLQANKAQKEFLEGDDQEKREVLEKLLWNLSLKSKSVASIKLKTPFDVMYKSPKDGDISTLLPDLGSNQD